MESDNDCQDDAWALLPEQHQRTILHIDIDCFYAQVEMVRNPDLKGKPVGIKQKNIMITCNYVARSLGVKKSMFVSEAKKFLPELMLVDGSDLTHYRHFSMEITKIAQEFSPHVERLGFDENFIDVSDRVGVFSESHGIEICGHYYGDKDGDSLQKSDLCGCGCYGRLIAGSHIAKELRERILEKTGITCCAGIAHNKLIAKLVSGYHKPDEQTVIFPWQVQNLMGSLKSVKSIPGIGSVTSKILSDLNIYSVEDLQNAGSKHLGSKFDTETSKRLKNVSFGIDEGPVQGSMLPQSIGLEDAFKEVTSFEEVKIKYQILLERLLKLLANDGRQPAALKVSVRKFDLSKRYGHRETKQVPVSHSFFSKGVADVSEDVKNALLDIIINACQKMVDMKKPFHLTMIALGFTKFISRVPDSKSITHFFQKRSHAELEETTVEIEEHDWGKRVYPCVDVNKKTKQEFFDEELHAINELKEKSCNFGGNVSTDNLSSSSSDEKNCNKKPNMNGKSTNEDEGQPYVSCRTASPSHQRDENDSEGIFPNEIDKDVFNALPAVLQEEILQSYRNRDRQHVTGELKKDQICGETSCIQNVRTIEKYFSPTKNSYQGSETPNTVAGTECERLKSINENVASCSRTVCSSSEIKSSNSFSDGDALSQQELDRELPQDIDISVFRELPEEIQAEILREKRKQKQGSNTVKAFKSASHKKKQGSSSSILKYFKKS